MKLLAAAAVGFVLGWAVCFAEGIWGSKFDGRTRTRLAERYAPEGGWPTPPPMPTDDEQCLTEHEGYVCTLPKGHRYNHLASCTDGVIAADWTVSS